MPNETTPLLPEPVHTHASALKVNLRKNWKQYGLYALLVAIGLGVGIGATLALDHHPKGDEHGPMVPPIYKLPPVRDKMHPATQRYHG